VFGFSFDTTGPRRRDVVATPATTTTTTPTRRGLFGRRRDAVTSDDGRVAADEPVTRERTAADEDVPVADRDRVTTTRDGS
jgi:hypothetical protein